MNAKPVMPVGFAFAQLRRFPFRSGPVTVAVLRLSLTKSEMFSPPIRILLILATAAYESYNLSLGQPVGYPLIVAAALPR